MSNWGDDQYDEDGIEAQPIDVDDEPNLRRPTVEPPEVVEAREALDKALGVRARAASLLDVARDALADAEGSLRVAEAKVADYEDDADKLAWQRVAAAELVEKARRAVARRSAAVDARERDLGETGTAVQAADQQLAVAIAEARPVDESRANEQPPTLYYGSVDEFVREYLRNVYRRRIDGRHRSWAGEWWRYDEAVIRLEALWRAWEQLRQDPSTGMSVWWRDHADHHMAVLMDPEGPFALATEGEANTSRKGDPLPYTAPPEGMFPDVRQEPGRVTGHLNSR